MQGAPRPTTRAPAPNGGRPWARGLSLAYGAAVAVFVIACCFLAVRDHHTLADQDDWRIFDDLFTRTALPWLFDSHIGHRVAPTLALLLLDYRHLGGHMHLPVLASLVCAFLAVGALALGLRAATDRAAPLPRALLAFAVFVFFWAHSGRVFLWGVMQGNPLAAMWMLLSLSWLVVYALGVERRAGLLVGSLVAATLATFSHGAGFASWVALLAVALLARLPARSVLVITASAAACIGLYSLGIGDDPGVEIGRSAARVGTRPFETLVFALAFAGSAAGRAFAALSIIPESARLAASAACGALGAAALAATAWRLASGRIPTGPRALLGVGLGSAMLACGAVVGFVRLAVFGMEQSITARFLNWSGLFWMGVALAAPVVRTRGGDSGARAAVAIALLAAVSLAMLPALGELRRKHMERRDFVARASMGLLLGVQDDRTARRLSLLSSAVVYRASAQMRRDGRNLFADPRRALPGTPLREHFALVPEARCRGEVERLDRVESARGVSAASLSGWASEAPGAAAPAFVVVTDTEDVVRGLAEIMTSGEADPASPRFSGYVAPFDPNTEYTAWAVLRGGEAACPFSRSGRLRVR